MLMNGVPNTLSKLSRLTREYALLLFVLNGTHA